MATKYIDLPNILKKDSAYVYDIDVVKQNLARLLTTDKGDLIDQPEYGVDLSRYIYEPMTEDTAVFIDMTVREAVSTWMSDQVEVRDLSVKVNVDEYAFIIELVVYSEEFDKEIVMEIPFDTP